MNQEKRYKKNLNLPLSIYGKFIILFACPFVLISSVLISDVYPDTQSAQYKEYEVKAAFMYNFLKFVDWPENKAKNNNQIVIGIIGQDPFGSAADILKDKKVEERNVILKRFDSLQQLRDSIEKEKSELNEKLKSLTKIHVVHKDDCKIIIKPIDEFNELKNITDPARSAKIEELKKQGYFLVDPSKPYDIKLTSEIIANGQIDCLKKCYLLFISQSEKKNTKEIIELLKDSSVLTISDSQGFLDAGGVANFVIEDNKVRFDINLTASEKAGLKIRSQLLRLAKKIIKDGVEVTGLSETAHKEAK